jgi:F-type H+-transporting ATPase subunit epsilon
MKLQIITPDKEVFSGEVISVRVPGSKGSFQILVNHAPIISTLDAGNVKIVDHEGKTSDLPIGGGVIEVKNNNIIILAESV